MYERDKNGVKKRADGRGDEWAEAHRALGREYHMSDVDCIFGMSVYGRNTGDKLFMEYVPDGYENRIKSIREFALVALFDRKTTIHAALNPHNKLSIDLYCWLCRVHRDRQPISPRFFLVIGDNAPQWEMVEVDIDSGQVIKKPKAVFVSSQNMRRVWHELGLSDTRNKLKGWIQ